MTAWRAQPGLKVAIDGPSGSGKGTVAQRVADMLGLPVLDTGLLYRLTGYLMIRQGLTADDEAAVAKLAESMLGDVVWNRQGICYRGQWLNDELRGEDTGAAASQVAAMPQVRQYLLSLQQQAAADGCVMDGRDIGTVVLPHARAKFFLTASQRERARRRWTQLQQAGRNVDIEQIHAEIKMRDQRDAARKYAPLKPAADAIVIDSTTMRIDQVVDRIIAVMARRHLIEAIT